MLDWLRDYLYRRAARRRADALSDADLNAMGLTRDEIRALADMPREISNRLTQMASVHGLTRSALQRDGAAYRDMTAGCAMCSHVHECRERLQDMAMLSPGDVAFCPNATALARLASRPSTWRRSRD